MRCCQLTTVLILAAPANENFLLCYGEAQLRNGHEKYARSRLKSGFFFELTIAVWLVQGCIHFKRILI